MNNVKFLSPIASYLNEFVEMKQSMGYKYDYIRYTLKSLDMLCSEKMNNSVSLSRDIVEYWVHKKPNETTRTFLNRVRLSNEIATYLLLRGVEAYVIPYEQIRSYRPEKYTPHIFNSDELERFFHAVDSHPPHRAHPISDKMYSTLFRLIYCCGLRISETLRITYSDIDIRNKTILIANSKFGKDRIVPMSETMFNMLNNYLDIVKEHYPDNKYIFSFAFRQ